MQSSVDTLSTTRQMVNGTGNNAMKPNFEVVTPKPESKDHYAVKAQVRKGGNWYTAADTFCIPGLMTADQMAQFIADALNREVAKRENKKAKQHFFNSVGHCEFCGVHYEEVNVTSKCPGE